MAPKDAPPPVTPELLLHAYCAGIFPMSDGSGDIYWVEPTERGIIPLDGFHISRSLRRAILKEDYRITVNGDFAGVLRGCADREETWISPEIASLYRMLHHMGYAHSLEVRRDGALIGGVYGVALGAAFFGESMFSRRSNASKIALAYLVDRLRAGGFALLDTQFITAHLKRLGAVEISRESYRALLERALAGQGDFLAQPSSEVSAAGVIQRSTQTS